MYSKKGEANIHGLLFSSWQLTTCRSQLSITTTCLIQKKPGLHFTVHTNREPEVKSGILLPPSTSNKQTLFHPWQFPFWHAYASAHQFGQTFYKVSIPFFYIYQCELPDIWKSFREQLGIMPSTSASSGHWGDLIPQSLEQTELMNMGTAFMYVLNLYISKPATCVQEPALIQTPLSNRQYQVTHFLDMHMHHLNVGKRPFLYKTQVVPNSIRPNQHHYQWCPLKWKQSC